ncbi:hypothetical protein CVT25_013653 [Psilocybe cyanescens]|uniref:OPT oligopeptide transporter n=1 Tax=Psilocybe cyanescens TaxID=93625 RepID=A0A409WTK8_PSICY|nr:hypothetical protein CVT25_013653 [Psilocybe cyanescens]
MNGFEVKDDIHPLDDYVLRDAEKSMDNHADSTSTYSGRGSGILSIFDPNYDSNSVLEDDSPYPEVRSAVANFDDPDMPASTLRAWVLGLVWAILLSGMNQFFYFRYPSVAIGGVLVTIMASVGAQSAYATDIVAVQRVSYGQAWNFSYNWMLVMSTQLIGFSMGGIARRFLVAPPSMIWPNTLVSCALFNTLHSQTYAGIGPRDGLSRERFFLYAFVGAIIWWVTGGSSIDDLLHQKVNQIFGYKTGLGFSIITLDWNQIAFIGSPLATPWWAEANVMIGFFFFYWFLTPLLYYKNVWHSQYMPISALIAYDNTGSPYNITRVVNHDGTLNREAYAQYSPLYLPIAFVMSYGLSFLSITATITHAIIHFYKPIRLQFGRSMREQPDIHARLMSQYPQVPDWYYACIFVLTFVFACVCIQLWPSGMTIWALVIALLISVVYVVPIGMIQAVTNRQVGLKSVIFFWCLVKNGNGVIYALMYSVITELIVGFMIPGKPNAMMIFKTYGYITMAQAMQFTADFKLGHYMKVPPRPMFWCQIVATVIAGTVQLGVQSWMFSNIEDICKPNQKNNFTCASTQVFSTASVIWGLIGPGLQFTRGQLYYLIFSGVGQIPPATAVNYVPWAIFGFIFQYAVRRKHFSYWAKYNYVLSAALDAGTAVGLILVFFCLQYPLDGDIGRDSIQKWWGNVVYKNTLDWNNVTFRKVEPGKTFGCALNLSYFLELHADESSGKMYLDGAATAAAIATGRHLKGNI